MKWPRAVVCFLLCHIMVAVLVGASEMGSTPVNLTTAYDYFKEKSLLYVAYGPLVTFFLFLISRLLAQTSPKYSLGGRRVLLSFLISLALSLAISAHNMLVSPWLKSPWSAFLTSIFFLSFILPCIYLLQRFFITKLTKNAT